MSPKDEGMAKAVGKSMIKSFLEAKNEFDSIYGKLLMLKRSIVPVDGKYIDNISLKDKGG